MHPPPLVDIGANLTHDSFDADRDDVIRRAVDAGVTRMVVTGATESGSRDALELARLRPGTLWATAGVHPHHAGDYTAVTTAALRELLSADEVVAAGECGLDYFRDYSPRAAQRAAFGAQLELAAETGLPVFLHQRDAHEDFVAIVREHRGGLARAVAHCFTGSAAELDACLDLDLHIGITGWICDERRGLHLRDLVADIPADRLMIETDAPYLLPRDLSPKPKTRRNEPGYLPHICRTVAECVRQDPAEVAAQTTATAIAFFGLPAEPATGSG